MISIIVPIYKSYETLERCLKSIQHQSYKNYEVIMINDGSPDDSEKICLEFQKKDKRFKYFFQENKGVSSARNKGIMHSKGQYITFVDSDDYLEYNYLKLLISFFNNNILLTALSYKKKKKEKLKLLYKDKILGELLINDNFGVAVHNKLFLSEIIVKNNIIFDETMKIAEDFKFLLEYIKYIDYAIFFDGKQAYNKEESYYNSGKLTNWDDKLIGLKYGFDLIHDNGVIGTSILKKYATIREYKICTSTFFFFPAPLTEKYSIFVRKFLKDNITCVLSPKVPFRYKIISFIIVFKPELLNVLRMLS